MRLGEAAGVIDPKKLAGGVMVGDILTKALAGSVFKKHCSSGVMGLLHIPKRDDWSIEPGGYTIAP